MIASEIMSDARHQLSKAIEPEKKTHEPRILFVSPKSFPESIL